MATPVITSIDAALRFVLIWAGREDVRLPAPASNVSKPTGLSQVVAASDLLGPDFYTSDTGTAPLLSVQVRILRPVEQQPDPDGVLPFIEENQGVYRLGFHPDAPDRLLADGDWIWGDEQLTTSGWSPLSMSPEQALITTVLTNAFYALCEKHDTREEADFDTIPADTPVLLWRHDSLGPQFPGFWGNPAGTHLYFGGMGQTAIGPSSCDHSNRE